MESAARIEALIFKYLSDDEVRARSVVEVTETGKPNSTNGLNDPRMGINKRGHLCPTCRQRECSGHNGHIELGTDVIRFGAGTEAKNVLRCVCEHCSRPRWLPVPGLTLQDMLEFADTGEPQSIRETRAAVEALEAMDALVDVVS